MTGAVALTLIAAPAFAQISSGNGANLLGRGAGNGSSAQQNSSTNNNQSSRSTDAWKNNMQEQSSSSGTAGMTTTPISAIRRIGGIYADPQIGAYQ
jgi:hypothetical protein